MAGHSEDFFKAMDDFKPYVLLEVSDNHLIIKRLADYINVDDIRKTLMKLINLGYRVDANVVLRAYWSGAIKRVELEPVRIEWDRGREKGHEQ